MKEKIEQLAKGKFEYRKPSLLLSEGKISIQVEAGKNYAGSFRISNSSKRRMKGILYSDRQCFSLQKDQFIGGDNEIPYIFYSEFFKTGESCLGALQIITDCGETKLPYEARIVSSCLLAAAKEVKDPSGFARLAREDWLEAARLFAKDDFSDAVLGKEERLQLLHQGLTEKKREWGPLQTSFCQAMLFQAMEEFLTASGLKAPMNVALETAELSYSAGLYSFSDKLKLCKEGWGYEDFRIVCDKDFIRLERDGFTTEDFAGSRLEIGFIVQPEGLKGGLHLARVSIFSEKRTMEAIISCHVAHERQEWRTERRKRRRAMAELTSNYLFFRSGQRNVWQYAAEAERLLNVFHEKEDGKTGQDAIIRLYRIHIWQVSGKNAAVKSALGDFVKEEELDSPEARAGLQYLLAIQREPALSAAEAAAQIRPLYQKKPDSWLLLWYLLYVDRAYQDPKSRYQAIRSNSNGSTSPVLLFEALAALREMPALLHGLGGFELRLLRFAVRYQSLTKDVLDQFLYLAEREKTLPPMLFHTLEKCYEAQPGSELLRVICVLIIQSQKKSPRCFFWLCLGVKAQLRITGLMEHYLDSMPEDFKEEIPPNVFLYFAYQNEMDSRKKALLYACVIRQKNKNIGAYSNYQEKIKEFASEQLQEGAISRNLAVIYQDVYANGFEKEEDLQNLHKIAFAYEVFCSVEKMQSIMVIHPGEEKEQQVPLAGGRAVVMLHSQEAELFFSDSKGIRYPAGNLINGKTKACKASMEKLVFFDSYLWQSYEKGCEELSLLMYCKERAKQAIKEQPGANDREVLENTQEGCIGEQGGMRAEELLLELHQKIAASGGITQKLRGQCIRWLIKKKAGDAWDERFHHYFRQLSFQACENEERAEILNLLIAHGFDVQAAKALQSYGMDGVAAERLCELAVRLISAQKKMEEDEFLLRLAQQALKGGAYHKSTLEYLCRFYHGSTAHMLALWTAAKEEGIDVEELEESLLGQMLFADSRLETSQALFVSYYGHGTNPKLIRAYLSCYAYKYLSKEQEESQELFDIIDRETALEEMEVCTLAQLKYYSGKPQLTKQQVNLIEHKLNRMLQKGILLPFYRRFDGIVKLPERMYDKYYVEHCANPENTVRIHYRMDEKEEYQTSEMGNVCYGFFVKEFVLFHGERLDYYITEEQDGQEVVAERDIVTMCMEAEGGQNSRYDALNRIIAAQAKREDAVVLELLENYIRVGYEIEQVFHPI